MMFEIPPCDALRFTYKTRIKHELYVSTSVTQSYTASTCVYLHEVSVRVLIKSP